VQNLASMMG
jgi:hypothetical protein